MVKELHKINTKLNCDLNTFHENIRKDKGLINSNQYLITENEKLRKLNKFYEDGESMLINFLNYELRPKGFNVIEPINNGVIGRVYKVENQ